MTGSNKERASLTTAIRFTAEWCRPCKSFAPVFDEFVSEQGISAQVVDIEAEPLTASGFGVTSLPTVVFMDNGFEVGRAIGARSKAELLAAMK